MTPSGFAAGAIADRLTAVHAQLALKWLERLASLLPVAPNEVFPSDHLLDHIPSLILEIADHLRTPEHQIVASTTVMTKAAELALLRLQQQASVHQLLREYELLSEILETFIHPLSGMATFALALPVIFWLGGSQRPPDR